MPYLIDGNNLTHALGKADGPSDRSGLCALLAEFGQGRHSVCVVFDGPAPSPAAVQQMTPEGLEIVFAGRRKADDVICERIAACTAPRRLNVVSSDREIRRAARRRRCGSTTSEEFVLVLYRAARSQARRRPSEPPEKRRGLGPGQVEKWLREFGLED